MQVLLDRHDHLCHFMSLLVASKHDVFVRFACCVASRFKLQMDWNQLGQQLMELLAHPGELVSRDHLLDVVWGHRHVTPGVLTRAIAQLRAYRIALLDLGDNEKTMVKVQVKGDDVFLTLHAIILVIQGKTLKIVSLQNIQSCSRARSINHC